MKNPYALASTLATAAHNYAPQAADEPITVLHDMVLHLCDVYCATFGIAKPQDKHLPLLFNALDRTVDAERGNG